MRSMLYYVIDAVGRARSALATFFDSVGRMRSMLYYVFDAVGRARSALTTLFDLPWGLVLWGFD